MRKQALRGSLLNNQPRGQGQNSNLGNNQCGRFFWNQRGTNNSSRGQRQGGANYRNNPRQSAPYNPDAMDTSVPHNEPSLKKTNNDT